MSRSRMLIFTFDVSSATDSEISQLREAIPPHGQVRDIPVDVELWEEPEPKVCENCGKPDPYNDHWDDLDGPNRAGWACPRC